MEDHLRLRDDRVVLGGRVLLLLGVWTLDLGDREMFIIAVNGNLVNRGVGREGGLIIMYLHATLQKSVGCQWIFTVGGGGEDKNDYAPREDSSTASAPPIHLDVRGSRGRRCNVHFVEVVGRVK